MPGPFIHTTLCLVRPGAYDQETDVVDLESYYCLSEDDRGIEMAVREIAPLFYIIVEVESIWTYEQLAHLVDESSPNLTYWPVSRVREDCRGFSRYISDNRFKSSSGSGIIGE